MESCRMNNNLFINKKENAFEDNNKYLYMCKKGGEIIIFFSHISTVVG